MDEIDLWDPWKRHGRKLNRLFEDFFPVARRSSDIREPLLDVVDEGENLRVLAELPGVEKDKINLEVEDDSLTLSTEIRSGEKKEEKDKGYYFHERSYQSFYRKIPLPAEVIADKASAEYRDGVLEVRLPKKTPSRPGKKGFKVQVK